MKLFLRILLNFCCPILGFLAGFYLVAAVTNSFVVPVSGIIGMSAGIVIPLYYQHKSWTAWELCKHSLIRIGFISLCIIIGLFVGGIIAGRIYDASHLPLLLDPGEKGAPGDGLAGIGESWQGALYGSAIGLIVGILVPIIWEIIIPKLKKTPGIIKLTS